MLRSSRHAKYEYSWVDTACQTQCQLGKHLDVVNNGS